MLLKIKNIIPIALFVALISCGSNTSEKKDGGAAQCVIAEECHVAETETAQDWASVLEHVEIPQLQSGQPQQIIEHIGYTVSHNPVWNIPNWVAYSLTDTELLGDIPRAKNFNPDPEVQGVAVVTRDYTHSGFDRGHMAPAADMKWSEQAMYESFYMTNICPQNQSLNRGDWNDLEELARDWANKYGEIHIVCGPLVAEQYSTIGQNTKIAIPEAFYKVFLRKEGERWVAIGFVMPNQAVNRPMMTYMLSVDEVEAMAGIDFFYNLPDHIENQTEQDYNVSDWTI